MKIILFYVLMWHLSVTLNGNAQTNMNWKQTFSNPHAKKEGAEKAKLHVNQVDVLNPLFILK